MRVLMRKLVSVLQHWTTKVERVREKTSSFYVTGKSRLLLRGLGPHSKEGRKSHSFLVRCDCCRTVSASVTVSVSQPIKQTASYRDESDLSL